ncbi:MAG TPA: hypothetical protein DCO86_04155 [Spirochaetaceae bacterium]|nr:hypothetical protein [Spirochaetaceae bacterium]
MFRKNKAILIEGILLLLVMTAKMVVGRCEGVSEAIGIAFEAMLVLLYCISAFPVAKGMIDEIREDGNVFSEEFLMVAASFAAVCLRDYAEAIGVIVLFRLGEAIADDSADRSRDEIKWLLDLHVRKCKVVSDGKITEVGVGEVTPGRVVCFSPGDVVPFDCRIASGRSFFDTSSITGESEPVSFGEGDEISSGFSVCDGAVRAVVLRECKDSTVANILRMIDDISTDKSKSEGFISNFSKIYTPLVLILSLIVAIAPPLITGSYDFAQWIYKAAGILVASCPCSLVVSVPLAFFIGAAALAGSKVFVRKSCVFDAALKSKTACFDKTGTLTTGKFVIGGFDCNIDEKFFKEAMSSAESFSKHPVAKAIFGAWKEFAKPSLVLGYREVSGEGVAFEYESRKLFIATEKDFASEKRYAALEDGSAAISDANAIQAVTIVNLIEADKVLGRVFLTDEIRDDAAEVISALKKDGVSCMMLTGDKARIAGRIASELGIEEFESEMLPQEKLSHVKELQNQGENVMFVGDGINDIAAMKASGIGIAMGGISSESTRNAADVILEGGSLSGIIEMRCVSRKIRKIVSENIISSIFVKSIIIALSMMGIVRVWMNVFADGGMLVMTVLNSLRLMGSAKSSNDRFSEATDS